MHIMVVSRTDLFFTLHHLDVFQPGPNRLGFQSLHQVLKYLRCHPNVPLFYPRQKITASNLYQLHHSERTKGATITIPNCLCGHVDASWKPFQGFGHSISGHLETILSVAVDWKVARQLSCATSTTDSKTRAFYVEGKRINSIRQFFMQLGKAINLPTPILSALETNTKFPTPIYEDNKGTRDMLQAQKVTTNLKHMDLPIGYLHNKIIMGSFYCKPCSGKVIFADFLTKQETGPIFKRQRDWYTGKQFYPPANSEHYKLLTSTAPLS